jgi:hypothetical protein
MWLAKAAIVCAPAGVAMKDIAWTNAFGSMGGGVAKAGLAYAVVGPFGVLICGK